MRVLIVCSKNSGKIAPFIEEQVSSLQCLSIETDYFTVEKKGWRGYLQSRKGLIDKIKQYAPDIIHAHFGLSGLLANLQRKVPVVTTYHGCDINKLSGRMLSLYPLLLSKHNIFVSKNQQQKVRIFKQKSSVIPCGIDFEMFFPESKKIAREKLNISDSDNIILFSSDFSRAEKNGDLAKSAVSKVAKCRLIEMKGFSRNEVREWMNACDVGLLTSIREGSPMFIKELISCNRPIVSTDVGDVRELIGDIDGCKVVPFDDEKIAKALEECINYERINYPTELYQKIDNKMIANKILSIYNRIK